MGVDVSHHRQAPSTDREHLAVLSPTAQQKPARHNRTLALPRCDPIYPLVSGAWRAWVRGCVHTQHGNTITHQGGSLTAHRGGTENRVMNAQQNTPLTAKVLTLVG